MLILCVSLFSSAREDGGFEEEESDTGMFVMLMCVCAGIVLLTIVIIMVLSRKRVRGITWFPEGFFSKSSEASKPVRNRNGPEGEEMQ